MLYIGCDNNNRGEAAFIFFTLYMRRKYKLNNFIYFAGPITEQSRIYTLIVILFSSHIGKLTKCAID